jgi:hypothetical protein
VLQAAVDVEVVGEGLRRQVGAGHRRLQHVAAVPVPVRVELGPEEPMVVSSIGTRMLHCSMAPASRGISEYASSIHCVIRQY